MAKRKINVFFKIDIDIVGYNVNCIDSLNFSNSRTILHLMLDCAYVAFQAA